MNKAVVVDTNIIVAALLSPEGTAFEFMSRVLDGNIPYWFIENAICVEPRQSHEPMPDEKDQIFYHLAKGCKARLITGNFKHYPVDECVIALWGLKSKI